MGERTTNGVRLSHSVGRPGIDRVRIFQRKAGGNFSYTTTGRPRPRILRIRGVAIRDFDRAKRIADKLSERLRQERDKQERAVLTPVKKVVRTLKDLLDALHAGKLRDEEWTCPKYRRDQEQMRDFWLNEARLEAEPERRGWADRLLLSITPVEVNFAVAMEVARRLRLQEEREEALAAYDQAAAVRRAVRARRREARRRGEKDLPKLPPKPHPPTSGREIRPWASPRTRNRPRRYLKDAFEYGHTQLQWLEPLETLSPLKLEKVQDQSGDAYDEEELERMGAVVDFIDLRLSVAYHIAWDTGRRIGAIRELRTENIIVLEGPSKIPVVEIVFAAPTDKARKRGGAAVSERTARLIVAIMKTPVVRETGILLPNRRNLSSLRAGRGELAVIETVSDTVMNDLLQEAEVEAGVPHTEGRLWHGIKRRSITMQARVAGRWDPVSRQSGTSVQTLRKIYDQFDREELHETVAALDARRAANAGPFGPEGPPPVDASEFAR